MKKVSLLKIEVEQFALEMQGRTQSTPIYDKLKELGIDVNKEMIVEDHINHVLIYNKEPDASDMDKLISAMKDIHEIQGNDGNWNYSSYMHGMFNGMEMFVAMAEQREPEFRDAPFVWKEDRPPKFEDPIGSDYKGEVKYGNRLLYRCHNEHCRNDYDDKFPYCPRCGKDKQTPVKVNRYMDIGGARDALKAGKRVKREAWGGYWELFKNPLCHQANEDQYNSSFEFQNGLIVAVLKDGGGCAPAQLYQADFLAEDWVIVE